MKESFQNERSKLATKYFEFELRGLKSYLKYLEKEFEKTDKTAHKKRYLDYIEKEIKRASTKIEKLNLKLGVK